MTKVGPGLSTDNILPEHTKRERKRRHDVDFDFEHPCDLRNSHATSRGGAKTKEGLRSRNIRNREEDDEDDEELCVGKLLLPPSFSYPPPFATHMYTSNDGRKEQSTLAHQGKKKIPYQEEEFRGNCERSKQQGAQARKRDPISLSRKARLLGRGRLLTPSAISKQGSFQNDARNGFSSLGTRPAAKPFETAAVEGQHVDEGRVAPGDTGGASVSANGKVLKSSLEAPVDCSTVSVSKRRLSAKPRDQHVQANRAVLLTPSSDSIYPAENGSIPLRAHGDAVASPNEGKAVAGFNRRSGISGRSDLSGSTQGTVPVSQLNAPKQAQGIRGKANASRYERSKLQNSVSEASGMSSSGARNIDQRTSRTVQSLAVRETTSGSRPTLASLGLDKPSTAHGGVSGRNSEESCHVSPWLLSAVPTLSNNGTSYRPVNAGQTHERRQLPTVPSRVSELEARGGIDRMGNDESGARKAHSHGKTLLAPGSRSTNSPPNGLLFQAGSSTGSGILYKATGNKTSRGKLEDHPERADKRDRKPPLGMTIDLPMGMAKSNSARGRAGSEAPLDTPGTNALATQERGPQPGCSDHRLGSTSGSPHMPNLAPPSAGETSGTAMNATRHIGGTSVEPRNGNPLSPLKPLPAAFEGGNKLGLAGQCNTLQGNTENPFTAKATAMKLPNRDGCGQEGACIAVSAIDIRDTSQHDGSQVESSSDVNVKFRDHANICPKPDAGNRPRFSTCDESDSQIAHCRTVGTLNSPYSGAESPCALRYSNGLTNSSKHASGESSGRGRADELLNELAELHERGAIDPAYVIQRLASRRPDAKLSDNAEEHCLSHTRLDTSSSATRPTPRAGYETGVGYAEPGGIRQSTCSVLAADRKASPYRTGAVTASSDKFLIARASSHEAPPVSTIREVKRRRYPKLSAFSDKVPENKQSAQHTPGTAAEDDPCNSSVAQLAAHKGLPTTPSAPHTKGLSCTDAGPGGLAATRPSACARPSPSGNTVPMNNDVAVQNPRKKLDNEDSSAGQDVVCKSPRLVGPSSTSWSAGSSSQRQEAESVANCTAPFALSDGSGTGGVSAEGSDQASVESMDPSCVHAKATTTDVATKSEVVLGGTERSPQFGGVNPKKTSGPRESTQTPKDNADGIPVATRVEKARVEFGVESGRVHKSSMKAATQNLKDRAAKGLGASRPSPSRGVFSNYGLRKRREVRQKSEKELLDQLEGLKRSELKRISAAARRLGNDPIRDVERKALDDWIASAAADDLRAIAVLRAAFQMDPKVADQRAEARIGAVSRLAGLNFRCLQALARRLDTSEGSAAWAYMLRLADNLEPM